MISTPDLINALTTQFGPVKRLRPPVVRAAFWLGLGALVLVLLAIAQGLRPDLPMLLHKPTFVISVAGALLTGVCAALAAFMLSLPDRSRLWLLLPAPTLVVWLSTIGYQCLTNWVVFRPGGIRLGETAGCFATLVLTSLPLSLAMLVMIRYAAPLRPIAATLSGSLAVAALAAAGLSLFHELDSSLMILMWNLGTTALLVGCGCTFGGRMLSWVGPDVGSINAAPPV